MRLRDPRADKLRDFRNRGGNRFLDVNPVWGVRRSAQKLRLEIEADLNGDVPHMRGRRHRRRPQTDLAFALKWARHNAIQIGRDWREDVASGLALAREFPRKFTMTAA